MEEKKEKEIELNNIEIVTQTSDSKHLLSQPSFVDKFVQAISFKKKCNRHFGNNLVFFFINGEPLCTIGPHWYLFLCMFTIFVCAGLFISFTIAKKSSETSFYIMLGATVLQCLSYTLTALKNPGIASIAEEVDENILKNEGYCRSCRIRFDYDIYHCNDCDVCIKGFDHHCPWTGKCIGRGNLKLFNFFITCTCAFIIIAIFTSIHVT